MSEHEGALLFLRHVITSSRHVHAVHANTARVESSRRANSEPRQTLALSRPPWPSCRGALSSVVPRRRLRRKDGGFVRTMDGVANGSLVRLVWDERLKVAGDGALALVRGARVGCHSCAFTKTPSKILI